MTLMMSGDKGISAFPKGDNLLTWIATVTGPDDSVYQGKTSKITVVYSYSPIFISRKFWLTKSTCIQYFLKAFNFDGEKYIFGQKIKLAKECLIC